MRNKSGNKGKVSESYAATMII